MTFFTNTVTKYILLKSLSFVIMVSAFLTTNAQTRFDSIPTETIKEWTLAASNAQAKVYINKIMCPDPYNGFDMYKLVFRIENLTKKYIAVDWDNILYYNQRNVNPTESKPEYHKRIALKPKQIIETTCSADDKDISIYVSLVGREAAEELKSIQFVNFKVYE